MRILLVILFVMASNSYAETKQGVLLDCENSIALQKKYDGLIHIARINEKKQEYFDRASYKLLSELNLDRLLKILLEDQVVDFKLAGIHLLLIDTKGYMKSNPEVMSVVKNYQDRIKLYNPAYDVYQVGSIPDKPVLGPYLVDKYKWMINSNNSLKDIKSTAILPLNFNGNLKGALILLSKDVKRYQPTLGTDFLEHYAIRLQISLENSFAYINQ